MKWFGRERLLRFGCRSDFGIRRTIGNCLLIGLLMFAAAVVFSCRERMAIRSTPQMNIEQRFWVRVLLAGNVERCTLRVRGGFSVLGSQGEVLVPETVFGDKGVPLELGISPAGLLIGGRVFATTEVTILPDEPYIFALDGFEYRGKLVLRANADLASFDAVNVVPLEAYLAGVVGAEMPDYWEGESLKAQAIAARTYCLYNKLKFGRDRHWDVMRTTASQVYNGLRAESGRVWNAINDTLGEVLVCEQSGGEGLFPTYYSSACGGHTEDAKNVFGDSLGPLGGVDCPYCKDVARPDVFFWPMARFEKADVNAALQAKYPKLKELGEITGIAASKQSDYTVRQGSPQADFSRLTMVRITGSTGKSDFLRAEDMRLTIDPTGNKLRSTCCKIIMMDDSWAFSTGRGFGHGVGMCQCGAEGMARQGKKAQEILSHYYPGSKIIKIY